MGETFPSLGMYVTNILLSFMGRVDLYAMILSNYAPRRNIDFNSFGKLYALFNPFLPVNLE
jgi:hypothetical protein